MSPSSHQGRLPRPGRRSPAGVVLLAAAAAVVLSLLLLGPREARASTASTTPSSCPRSAPQHVPAGAGPASGRGRLATPGAVALRLCAYAGLNSHPRLHLLRSRLITGAGRLSGFVTALNRLPRPPTLAACPEDDGAEILALLAYRGGGRNAVVVGASGCQIVTNGRVTRTAAGTAFLSRIEQLAGSHPQ